MSRRHASRTRLAAAALLGLLLVGCAQVTPTRFYMLSSVLAAPGEAAERPDPDLAVGIGAVSLPEYLNRPQLVTRDGSNRVILSEFDNWIEPLQGLVARTLAENLSILLGTDNVLTLPQRRPFRPDYQVEIEVMRFDADTSGNAVLDARWWLLGARGETVLQRARTTLVEPAPSGDRAAAARALSQALGALSHEIAAAIVAAERS